MVECECCNFDYAKITSGGFNRYMVECELQKEKQHYFAVLVLIDTWWNVNNKDYPIYDNNDSGFNRYMVECE